MLVVILCFAATIAAPTPPASTAAPTTTPATGPATVLFSQPIGDPGDVLGDGFYIRDAYTSENTWYLPGYWHTGEDWYRQRGNTAGAHVYAIAAGTVVYTDSNYPGRVVIIRHAANLYSMYGHLDPALAVHVGEPVTRGQLLGTVLQRTDGVPSHLHFEVRTFLKTSAVNGSAPRYRFQWGVDCPPGPGYWPMSDHDLPSDMGWRNPTHVIARRAWPATTGQPIGSVIVAAVPAEAATGIWPAPPGTTGARERGALPLVPGTTLTLLAVHTGAEASRGTSADAYVLWYRVRLADGTSGWIQAAIPTAHDTGSDGRPSSVVFNVYPVVVAPA